MRLYRPDRIRKRRLQLEFTQEMLARKAGTSREYIIEIEKGRKIPKAPMLAKIAYALKVRESYFFA